MTDALEYAAEGVPAFLVFILLVVAPVTLATSTWAAARECIRERSWWFSGVWTVVAVIFGCATVFGIRFWVVLFMPTVAT